jgi:hypothetical protein
MAAVWLSCAILTKTLGQCEVAHHQSLVDVRQVKIARQSFLAEDVDRGAKNACCAKLGTSASSARYGMSRFSGASPIPGSTAIRLRAFGQKQGGAAARTAIIVARKTGHGSFVCLRRIRSNDKKRGIQVFTQISAFPDLLGSSNHDAA